MDICYVINSLSVGGAENLISALVNHSNQDENSYTVCQIGGVESLADQIADIPDVSHVNFKASFKFDPIAVGRMVKFFNDREFDVLHCHLPYAQTLGRIVGNLSGNSPVISTQHNVRDNYHIVTRCLERITRPLDSVTVAVSQGVEESFQGTSSKYPNISNNWTTIYNGIPVEEFSEKVENSDDADLRDKYRIGSEHVYLSIGNYYKVKRQEMLISAMELLSEDDSKLIIVGDGPRKRELRAEINRRGLEDSVFVTGRVESVYPFYKLADSFVLSSIREGLPMVIIEAMAAELPIVATDIPGVREIVKDEENGILVEPESPTKIAQAMAEIRKANEFGMRSKLIAKEELDISITYNKYKSLYSDLSNESEENI